jgi:hypothetical protein
MPLPHNGPREGNVFSASFFKQTLSTGGPLDLFVAFASTNPISRLEVLSIDVSFWELRNLHNAAGSRRAAAEGQHIWGRRHNDHANQSARLDWNTDCWQ